MNKKMWVNPEVISLGVESTEGNHWCGKNHDGEYRDWDIFQWHELHS